MRKFLLPALALLLCAGSAQAASHDVDFSLWSPEVQWRAPGDDIDVFRLALYGRNHDVSGLDVGAVSIVTGEFNGLQKAFFFGRTEADFNGVQLGLVSRVRGEMYGVDLGAVNFVNGDACGVQGGFYSQVAGEMKGVQAGFVNNSARLNGLQLGLVNFAGKGYGLQIGLLNFFEDGFVGCCPFFNFNF